jgi:hypothetical protein
MRKPDARDLLERIGALRHRCDVDLLVFFARHPRSLLTSESVAAFLGYDLTRIAESLEVLLSAGLLKRTLTPAHAARMYVFVEDGPHEEATHRLVELSSTREGRLAMREALGERARERGDPVPSEKPGPRALVVPLRAEGTADPSGRAAERARRS